MGGSQCERVEVHGCSIGSDADSETALTCGICVICGIVSVTERNVDSERRDVLREVDGGGVGGC